MKARILIDTGPIVALFRPSDASHAICMRQAKVLPAVAYTCWPIITEAAYLLRRAPRAVRGLISSCDGSHFRLLPLNEDDLAGINSILDRYADQRFDFADAALMHLADRENLDTVFTLNRRHFSAFRTAAGRALTVLPETAD